MSHDLNDTLIFVKVVEQGSFIAAAKILGQPKTTVSRKVQELEVRLGAQLLHRTTRKLGLTEAGKVYYEHCQRIASHLSEAESAVSQLQAGPRGWLRFTAPYSIGIDRIAPLLGEFHARYPEIRVDMLLTNDTLDLVGKEIDVALRLGSLPDSNLIARRLAVLRTQVYASSSYIEQHGEPLTPDDLKHHRALAMSKHHRGGSYAWGLHDGEQLVEFPINPILVANDPAALKGALLCGEGLMLTADVMVRQYAEQGYVRRVLAGWTGPEYELNAVFPQGHVQSPKVRAFVDFLVERVNLDVDVMENLCPSMQGRCYRSDSESGEVVKQEMTKIRKAVVDGDRPSPYAPVPSAVPVVAERD
ncbi:LysR family transcriptional regulator [Pseudoxanthomonas dokdonensis]|uniref:LysR family transcriptional regulator n=1 Tax=Pseudoxanthomonas dokdonensis TaxID=344882 RepID=A0A0R0CVG9_9GAMM|nr:LysR family transcriptional regulator [Pseudoxanthomonas dokdonensis]KRG69998.1 LysR family transcriptional regulator [Pseudoxanthomonas dokdonensis]